MNISKIIDLFRKGQSVANPAAWKNTQTSINSLVILITVFAEFGRSVNPAINITPDMILTISTWVIAGIAGLNTIITIISSTKVGLPPKKG